MSATAIPRKDQQFLRRWRVRGDATLRPRELCDQKADRDRCHAHREIRSVGSPSMSTMSINDAQTDPAGRAYVVSHVGLHSDPPEALAADVGQRGSARGATPAAGFPSTTQKACDLRAPLLGRC
jgi:hypothetical protein